MFPVQVLLSLFVLHVILFAFVLGLPPRGTTNPKVFVIGLSKTGTTSLGDAFEILNYGRSGWTDIWPRYLCHQAMLPTPNLRPVISMSEKYKSFEDLPWSHPQVYTKMSKTYPNSKFILSLRKSEKIIYGAYQVDGNEDEYLKMYVEHMRDVRELFATEEMEGRGMEIVIDDLEEPDETRWGKLVEFLEIDVPGGVRTLGDFPKSNGGGIWINKDPMGTIWVKYQLMWWAEKGIVTWFGGMGKLIALGF
ncbi:uncharacterized protein PAC_13875 [Phialocephala subalpina]|uniref:Sulfotransferase domain-containing protein n=1 Tax=Phialocephala subalpina TaxID=576137 RepID=A0A1L7XG44_9HELO|nr:uncharacterized protein PAC_13875 [Phialocephala subalpina]